MNGIYRHSPFFIGLDKTLETLETLASQQSNYPPYNIVETDDGHFVVEFAVAGFHSDELHVEQDRRILAVEGKKKIEESEDIPYQYHHRGISQKNFQRKFTLGEYVEVEAVNLKQGILEIILVKNIPEEQRPKQFEVNSD